MAKTQASKLFGTDGIRGEFGKFPLDRASLHKLGAALGDCLKGAKILFGRDTRGSGEDIETWIASGISAKADLYTSRVIPTPGLSFLTREGSYDYGIMITASHNPYKDNGIKILNRQGEKIPEDLERDIEDAFWAAVEPGNGGSHVSDLDPLQEQAYSDFLIRLAGDVKGEKLRILLDCANGAVYRVAPAVFSTIFPYVEVIHANPDGQNINRQCGSTYPEPLKEQVLAGGADIGIAFDGDGDRVIFVDEEGNILDGDHALFALSRYFLAVQPGFNKTVVGTVVGNLGLETALSEMGVRYLRAPVGDKHVYREMVKNDALLGGEQSGHTIIRTLQKSGDGILTALFFLKALIHEGFRPRDIFHQLALYPQVTRSIPIREKKDLESWDEMNGLIRDFEEKHGQYSRVLIRYSGTEPKIRVMLESREESLVRENLEKFENLIKSTIGA